MSELDELSPQPAPADAARLRELINGMRYTQMLHVVAKLGIADLLSGGPLSAAELAATVRCDADHLYRLLRALASLGVFAEDAAGSFALTPPAQLLRRDVPGSLRAAAIAFGAPNFWLPWGQLLQSVKSGGPVAQLALGGEYFDYLARHPEEHSDFNDFMAEGTVSITPALLEAYDFSAFKTIVDVGGGHGALLQAILRRCPQTQGLLFDMPAVVQDAEKVIVAAGLAQRCQAMAGDFFQAVPSGGDAYLLKWILHDWPDAPARVILRNCRKAMPPHGKLLVVEGIIPPGNGPHPAKLSDIMMMALLGSRERSEAEYAALLASAGFRLTRVVPTASPFSIIEAEPV